MKVEIDAKGFLTISAESPLEQYALKRWAEENEVPADLEKPQKILIIFRK